MSLAELQPGDAVLAGKDIFNDGSFPDSEADELLVKQGTKGMIIKQGYLEEDETRSIYLVSFEKDSAAGNGVELGPPIGCWPEDLDCIPYG